jgi:hypothetical protein
MFLMYKTLSLHHILIFRLIFNILFFTTFLFCHYTFTVLSLPIQSHCRKAPKIRGSTYVSQSLSNTTRRGPTCIILRYRKIPARTTHRKSLTYRAVARHIVEKNYFEFLICLLSGSLFSLFFCFLWFWVYCTTNLRIQNTYIKRKIIYI